MEKTKGLTSKQLLKIKTSKSNIVISGTIGHHGAKQTRGIDLRHFYENNGTLAPTTRGIFLTQEDLYALLSELGYDPADLDSRVKSFLQGESQEEKIRLLGLKGFNGQGT